MRVIESDCVGCERCGNCGNKHMLHTYCDCCEQEFDPDDLRDFYGEDLCEECLLDQFPTIDIERDMVGGDYDD